MGSDPTPGAARGPGPPVPAPLFERDLYVDFLRAGSILVVVLWHWAFTILIWTRRRVPSRRARSASPPAYGS